MTQQEASAKLPADAKWSCSFGNPGEGGFCEFYRTPDGKRFEIKNGTWGDDWSCTEIVEREPRTAAGSLD